MRYKLEELCNMQSGGTPRRGEDAYYAGDIPWATITDFGNSINGVIFKTEKNITIAGLKSINNRLFKKGTLLLAMYGSVGKTAIAGIELSTNQAILGITPKNSEILNIKYLKYWFEYNKGFIYSQGKGATLHNISLTIVKRQEIDLPDIETQNKIVAVLDKASSLISKREETIQLLDELLRATFLDMFGDPSQSIKVSKRVSLNELGNWKSGGTPSRSNIDSFEGDIPWVTSGELNDLYISETKEKITQKAIENSNAKLIEAGSLLLGMYDTAALKSSISTIELTCNQAIAYAKLDEKKCNSKFVYYNIQLGRDFFKSQQRGVRQQNMNLSMIKGIKILYPDIDEQNKFSNYVDKIYSNKQILNKNKTLLLDLQKSLLQKAFNGELNFNVDLELDALINEIKLQSRYNDLTKISGDIAYLQRLVDKLNNQEFKERDLYDKAKYAVFQLLKEDNKIVQEYDEDTKSLKLAMK